MRPMEALRKFRRLRKRSDKVKLALLMFLLAAGFAVNLAAQAAGYAAQAGKPVEYILDSQFTGPVLDAKLEQLARIPGLIGASRMREYTITSGDSGGKILTVTELSEQYIYECYGLAGTGEANQLWLEPESLKAFAGRDAISPVRLEYQTGERTESGIFTSMPTLSGVQAVARGSSLTLGEASTVRVMLSSSDVTGTAVKRMEALGFTLRSREQLITEDYEAQLLMTRLGYGLCAMPLSALTGWTLLSTGLKEDKIERMRRVSFTKPDNRQQ